MTVFDTNLSVLAGLDASICDLIDKTPGIEDFELRTAADANPTARVSGIYLHSKHAPAREAERLAAAVKEDEPEFLVLIGLGFGYIAEQCLVDFPETHLYIVIPNAGLFKEIIRFRDLSNIFTSPRVTILFQPEVGELTRFISSEKRKSFSVLTNRGILQLYPDYCQRIRAALAAYRSKTEINENTLIRFGETWVKNVINNMQILERSRNIRSLRGAFGGLPKLLLAAGPSLDAVRPGLSELRQRCVLIAVDTSARFCAAAGIEPDFLVVVDPQYWNTRHLDRFPFSNTVLISEPSTHPRTFRICSGPVFMGGSVFPLGSVLEQALGKRDLLGSGGSVATTAWDFARYLGTGPIYCTGLDLGYPDNQTHFTGSYFEMRVHYLSRRTEPAETMIFSYLYSGAPYSTEAAGGGKVLTDKRLAVYAKWFEQQLDASSPEVVPSGSGQAAVQPDTYTLSPKGAAIAGMKPAEIDDILELPVKRNEIQNILGKLQQRQGSLSAGVSAINAAFRNLREELCSLEKIVDRGIDLSKKLATAAQQNEVPSILDALQAVDIDISSSRIKEIAGFLLQKTAKEVSKTGTGAENSLKLYSALKKSIRYHMELISRHLETE